MDFSIKIINCNGVIQAYENIYFSKLKSTRKKVLIIRNWENPTQIFWKGFICKGLEAMRIR